MVTDWAGAVPADARLIIASGSRPVNTPQPGTFTLAAADQNVTRLIAIWTRDTPHIGHLAIEWQFGAYSGVFNPTEGDREPDTSADRLVYAYEPDPRGPFRQGTHRTKLWEAWTVVAPNPDVKSAGITILTGGMAHTVIVGAAIVRNGRVACIDGPKPDAAQCAVTFS